jgi:putative ABC transport system ATP-binding protein
MSVIELRGVTHTYPTPRGPFAALTAIDLAFDSGELVAIVGKSGSGKSTLLNVIAGIDRPSAGAVTIAGTPIHTLGEGSLAAWRGRHVGVVFQFFQLLPTLTVVENVMLPIDFCGKLPAAKARARAAELLDSVGIADQANKLPQALSGGQQQRAAIARALANDPPVLLADEPTGNLDSQTGEEVFSLLAQLATRGTAVIIVTHERELADRAARVVTLVDGRLAHA